MLRASSKFQKDPAKDKEDRKRKVEANEPLLAHALINNILKPAKDTIGNEPLLAHALINNILKPARDTIGNFCCSGDPNYE